MDPIPLKGYYSTYLWDPGEGMRIMMFPLSGIYCKPFDFPKATLATHGSPTASLRASLTRWREYSWILHFRAYKGFRAFRAFRAFG